MWDKTERMFESIIDAKGKIRSLPRDTTENSQATRQERRKRRS